MNINILVAEKGGPDPLGPIAESATDMYEQCLSRYSQETMKDKFVHKEQCLSYPATKLCILTHADSGVPIPNVVGCCESHFTFHTY